MKIYIPFQPRDIGGPSTFAKKFSEGMRQRGHEVTFEETLDYDVLFLIVQAPFSILWRAKKRKVPIIQRLDGVYYWSVAGWRYPLLNLKARLIRHFFADYTIYQSLYSQRCAERFLGKKNLPTSVIYNGVSLKLFSPEGEKQRLRDFPDQALFFTASDFRRTDQIVPLITALNTYKKKYSSSFKFVIAGSFSRELQGFEETLKQYPWVKLLGKIPNEKLPPYERDADVFLFTHINPPCPNNIIEAMSTGLPVCAVADGAMPELVQHNTNGLLLHATGEAFWERRDYNPEEFADNLNTLLKNRENFSRKSRERAEELFSLESMIDQYEHALLSQLKK